MTSSRIRYLLPLLLLLSTGFIDASPRGQNFITFETGQVRPLAQTPDGNLLLVANTPNNTVEVYGVTASGLTSLTSIPVGLEPVAIATPNNGEAWVVNHLSDSISVIDLTTSPMKIKRTLNVGDEPRDIVFAGTNNKFAFVTTAHRGQNGADDAPIDAQLMTPGVGRADVWVFDRNANDASLGGAPRTVINLFGDTPRALAVSPDGKTVYAAVFLSGNKSTVLGEDFFLNKRGPTHSSDGVVQPATGLIVQFNGTNWVDETGSTADLDGNAYDDKVPFSLPDYDVFTIDASLATPAKTTTRYSGVGTVLFNMTVNPKSGAVYVSNTEALNLTRFEGGGVSIDQKTLQGNFSKSRITVINNDGVLPVDLNPKIDFSKPGKQKDRDIAVSIPLEMAISSNGKTLYSTSFGSQKLSVYKVKDLESGKVTQSKGKQINLSAGGPSGIVLDEKHKRLYVLTRFDNGISVINTNNGKEVDHLTMYNPEPDSVIAGRPFLYDTRISSSHGTSSCAVCHVFGDMDGLAWDLGNPDGVVVNNPNLFIDFFNELLSDPITFHPMKGPMNTLSLRGMAGNGPMHWRGDRTGNVREEGETLENAAFKEFNVAFPDLLGREEQLTESEMQAYTDFALKLTYPPSPIRKLDNTLTPNQALGSATFFNDLTTGEVITCNGCHDVDPANNLFGTAGGSSVEGPAISQQFKSPHFRNMYQKVGKFGNSGKFASDPTQFGPQIRGFGFMHDGGMDTLDKFLTAEIFKFDPDPVTDVIKRGQVVDFILASDSEMPPIVGQQVTIANGSSAAVHGRLDLLKARAQVTSPRAECDLIAKGVIDDLPRGYLLKADGRFQSDKSSEVLTDTQLRAKVLNNDQTITFTCVPSGSGNWMGIDRDEDGILDRDEIDNGTAPF